MSRSVRTALVAALGLALSVFVCHKRVLAAPIVVADPVAHTLTILLPTGEAHTFAPAAGFFARSTPAVGDYFIVYEDGYQSHSPKAAFEAGYHAATDEPPHGTDRMLQFFAYQHLPEHLQAHSKPFHDLAQTIVDTLPANAERTTALRKLLEAKDCAVRARIYKEPERTA
ncbi:hypothetical protein [Azospirillum sp. TSA2s]|uniref:hypothetical protein n=1 Tax=Azospirillum sp. TSA2s TaxID=709810 RepID=UPI001B3B5552|nr:hypothetical protein [Azospirillum sp. TSA2s]